MLYRILITSFLFVFMLSTARAESEAATSVVGSWTLYKDDQKPQGIAHSENLHVWKDGKFYIEKDKPLQGTYNVIDNQIHMWVQIGNQQVPINFVFKMKNGEMHFKHEGEGWTYYKKAAAHAHPSKFGL